MLIYNQYFSLEKALCQMVRQNIPQAKNMLQRIYSWTTHKINNVCSYLKNNWPRAKLNNLSKNPAEKLSYRRYVKQKFKKRKVTQNKFTLQKKLKGFLYKSAKSLEHNDLSCPICIQYLALPTSTPCGHTFCFKCIDEVLLFNSQCPVCRESIRALDPTPCTMLDSIIRKRAQYSMNETALKIYRQRVQQGMKWQQDRNINLQKLSIGDQIDVRDTEFIWCLANIVQIYKSQEKITGVLIHYKGWNKIYDEIIEVRSSRLAPAGFFTNRKDIARYNLSEMDNNMRGAVTFGQPEQISDNQINIQNNRPNRSVSDYFLNSLAFVLQGNSNRIFTLGDPNIFDSSRRSNPFERNLNFQQVAVHENEEPIHIQQEAIQDRNEDVNQQLSVPFEYSQNSGQQRRPLQDNSERQIFQGVNLQGNQSLSGIIMQEEQNIVIQISDSSQIQSSEQNLSNQALVHSREVVDQEEENISQNDNSL